MARSPVLDIPLTEVMKPEIALVLRGVLKLYTVGNLLNAWKNPANHRSIERVFDSPKQARNAVATCATWLGINCLPSHEVPQTWWITDGERQGSAAAAKN